MTNMYNKIGDFDYYLPQELIATESKVKRDESRLLVAKNAQLLDLQFSNIIDLITTNDLLILNNSKVIKARLYGSKLTGGKIEILVERILSNQYFTCHIKSNKTIPIGLFINLPNNLQVKVVEKLDGIFKAEILKELNFYEYLEQYGLIPLPPYINREATIDDATFYQTVYAKNLGSVAAPTAGLHFTQKLLNQLTQKGVKISHLTLHVGSGTFKPVSVNDIRNHKMHSEAYSITNDTINLIKQTKQNGGSIIAVGTTSLRTLESVALNNYTAGDFDTDIFITPGFKFKVVDKLITNFHLPKSTLLMLVSAFAGYKNIKNIYQHAINKKYKFFSYGDSMLLECKE